VVISSEKFTISGMGRIDARKIRLKTGQSLVIRTAQTKDAADILEHALKIIAEDPYNITTQGELNMTTEQEQRWIEKRLNNPANIILLAEVDGCMAAMAHFENGSRRRTAHRGTVRLNVHRQFRRKGVATALLDALIEWARANQVIEKLCLSVFENNEPAIELYKKAGFVEEGRYRKEIKLAPGQYIDIVRMCKFVTD
jgi:RimJ/RimL family protein N-acetyltransferase